MEEIKFDLIKRICEKQNFNELLLRILRNNNENRINKILEEIEENKKICKRLKRKIYEEIFYYVDDVNKCVEKNLKDIFYFAAKETIIQINDELKGEDFNMPGKIKIIIADDNLYIC